MFMWANLLSNLPFSAGVTSAHGYSLDNQCDNQCPYVYSYLQRTLNNAPRTPVDQSESLLVCHVTLCAIY